MPARLAQLLVKRGLLAPERANEALHQLAVVGGGLDTVLLERGWTSEAPLLLAMSELSGLRAVNLADFEPNTEVAHLIPPKIAERLCVVPLSVEGATLHVACGYPVRKSELDEVAFLLGKQLELWVALEVRVRDWIAAIYRQPLPARFATVLAAREPASAAPPASRQSTPAEVVDRLASAVIEEPIPLEIVKKPGRAPEARPPTRPEFPAPPPASAAPPPARARVAAPAPVIELELDDHEIAAPSAPAPARAAPGSAGRPGMAVAWGPPQTAAPPSPRSGATPLSPLLSSTTPGAHAPAPAPRPPPAPVATVASDDEVPDWTLAQARAAVRSAAASADREALVDVILRFARRTFDFAAAFAVIRGAAVGWDARGEGGSREQAAQVSIPLDSASVFRTVALSRGSFTGPLPPDQLSAHFLSLLGRSPRSVFLFPIEVKARLVALVYGDAGQKPISQRKLSDLLLFCQDLPSAFQELIFKRKQRSGGSPSAFEDPLIDPATAPVGGGPSAPASLGWGAYAPQGSGARTGRAVSMPGLVIVDSERPPPDFGPLLRRLTGPDATERARAMAELARSPEASSRALAQHFPGPTAWSRLPVVELPEADELGPVPGALARLGRPAAAALAPLLDSDDSDTRYLALLTAGNLPYPELVDGVLRGLFDYEPDISSAARAAATALRKVPRFDTQMKGLRQELASMDPLRRSLAARALGVLHDREAIEGLVGLTGSDELMTAQAAAEALREITRQNFGLNPRQWQKWWAENRGRRRIEWVVAALRHPELELRMAAIEELTRVLNDSLGYLPDAPDGEREAATQRWEAFLVQRGRNQRIDL